MGNKKGRKPRISVRLKRKRLGKQAKADKRKITAQPSTPHVVNDSAICNSANERTIEQPLSDHFEDDNESQDFIIQGNVSTGSENGNKTDFGRRIVNVSQFFAHLQEISAHGPLNCGLKSVEIVSETKTGLISLFSLKCKMCKMSFLVHNDNAVDTLDLNISAVAGTVNIGCGHTQLTDLSAAIGIAPMSKKIFSSKMTIVHKKWEEELLKSMNEAAEEERSLAMKEGRVNADGVAIIDVIADGCYSKRSYKKNYSALSGAATIIGKRTNKILYVAIKNKYCSICSVAQSKNVDAKEHTCYKNYSGSSTGMESEILVEGFKRSIDMHNLIYGRLISDGDANTYSKILQTRPYANHTVEKIECRNHLLRNMCNKLAAITTDTKYVLKFRKNVTKKRILSTRKVIIKSIEKHKNSNDVTGLYRDILNAPEHAFGRHAQCQSYYCTKNKEDEDVEKELFTNSIWQRVKLIACQIAAHARSLIVDVDSNTVEGYHSVVAKFVGGKRVNFTQRYQYQMRCNVAALSFNTNKPMSMLHKSLIGQSPRNEIARNERKKERSRMLMQKYLRKKRRLYEKTDTSSYGENCAKPDIAADMMEGAKKDFLKNLQRSEADRKQICIDTVLQSGSSEWMELRRNILTASNFGRVIKRRLDISCHNMVKDLLYKKSIDHVASIKHGKDSEKDALEQLAEQEGVDIEKCGLYIDPDVPYFGATPDGIVMNQKIIVEVKCPKSIYEMEINKAIEENKVPFYKRSKNAIMINKEHNWFYQVQGQLHVTRMDKCLFAIWSGANFPLKTETIIRDDLFWENKMEEKLRKFYLDCLLPELIDPRHTRKMPIRDPVYLIEGIEARKKKMNKKKNLDPAKIQSTDGTETLPNPNNTDQAHLEVTPPPKRRRHI